MAHQRVLSGEVPNPMNLGRRTHSCVPRVWHGHIDALVLIEQVPDRCRGAV